MLIGRFPGRTQEEVASEVKKAGGHIEKVISESTTHVVVSNPKVNEC